MIVIAAFNNLLTLRIKKSYIRAKKYFEIKILIKNTFQGINPLKYEFEKMLPHELEEAVARMPVAYVPWGALEWHGPHLPVGLDAIKAHELCLRIASTAGGGVVLPPCHISHDTMPFPWTFKYPVSIVRRALWATLQQLEASGFRAILVITGHYPATQVLLFITLAELFMVSHRAAVAACPEFFAALEKGYYGDHAALWETSILMYLFPNLVDLEQLRIKSKNKIFGLFRSGVMGKDPLRHASPELGKEIVDYMVARFSELARELAERPNKQTACRFHRDVIRRFVKP